MGLPLKNDDFVFKNGRNYFAIRGTKKVIATKSLTPGAPPVGNTNVLIGLQGANVGAYTAQVVVLADAPEGGTCHP